MLEVLHVVPHCTELVAVHTLCELGCAFSGMQERQSYFPLFVLEHMMTAYHCLKSTLFSKRDMV